MKAINYDDFKYRAIKFKGAMRSIWYSNRRMVANFLAVITVLFFIWIIFSFLIWLTTDEFFQHETFVRMLSSQWGPIRNVIHKLW